MVGPRAGLDITKKRQSLLLLGIESHFPTVCWPQRYKIVRNGYALLFPVGKCSYLMCCWSQWPRGIVAASLLGLWIRISPEVWKSVSCDCCVLTGRGPSVGHITRPENSYWELCIKWVRPRSPVIGCIDPESGLRTTKKKNCCWEVLYKNPNVFLWVVCTKCIFAHCKFFLRKYQKFKLHPPLKFVHRI